MQKSRLRLSFRNSLRGRNRRNTELDRSGQLPNFARPVSSESLRITPSPDITRSISASPTPTEGGKRPSSGLSASGITRSLSNRIAGKLKKSQGDRLSPSPLYDMPYTTTENTVDLIGASVPLLQHAQADPRLWAELSEIVVVIRRPGTADAEKLDETLDILTDWICETLSDRRIVVRSSSFFDDLEDGAVLIELLEELTRCEPVLSKKEMLSRNPGGRKKKLETLLAMVNGVLPPYFPRRWPLGALYACCPVAMLLLVSSLAKFFPTGPSIPSDVRVQAIRHQSSHEPDSRSAVTIEKNFDVFLSSKEVSTGLTAQESQEEVVPVYEEISQPDGFSNEIDHVFRQGGEQIEKKKAELISWLNERLQPVGQKFSSFEELSFGEAFIQLAAVEGKFFPLLSTYWRTSPNLDHRQRKTNFEEAFKLFHEEGLPTINYGQCPPAQLALGDEWSMMYLICLLKEFYTYRDQEQTGS